MVVGVVGRVVGGQMCRGPPIGDTASMEFRRAVRVSGLVVAVMATGCTANSPATRSAEVYLVYRDLAGWSAEIPPGWKVLPFETSKGDASAVGTQISNVELPVPEIDPGLPIQTSGLVLPPDGVSLIIATDNDPKNVQVPPESTSAATVHGGLRPGECHRRRADVLVLVVRGEREPPPRLDQGGSTG